MTPVHSVESWYWAERHSAILPIDLLMLGMHSLDSLHP
jgi:hypothetical protein